jgi:ribosomal protein S18 acetylase RimI-like enzyme
MGRTNGETGVTIRVAGPKDIRTLARIHVASWDVAYRGIMPDDMIAKTDLAYRIRDWSRRLAEPDWPAFLMEVDGEAVGFYHITASPDADVDPRTAGHITSFHILPHLRGKGYGRTLMDHAMKEFSRRGLTQATLWVLEKNKPARQFYDALGWTADGARKDYPRTDVPELRYRIRIPHPDDL